MNDKQHKIETLTDMHAKLCLLRSGIMDFEDWRKEMLTWAVAYTDDKGKEHVQANGERENRGYS